ncbi:hypothetical protein [Fusobacterium ulcerans]|uniref:hypothetical protein n=1 Tax=Fusobacterium ulcerans TaxID=861 RepID=UPI0027B92552|nr:hypothetical protein [Fusobacterium ulcerans]
MIKIHSKFVKENDIVSFKPDALKTIEGCFNIEYEKVKILIEEDNINEYFLNQDYTLFNCIIEIDKYIKSPKFKHLTENSIKNIFLLFAKCYYYTENKNNLLIHFHTFDGFPKSISNIEYEVYFENDNKFILNFKIKNLLLKNEISEI